MHIATTATAKATSRMIIITEIAGKEYNQSDYNHHLSKRRIVSLMNDIMEYKNGVLRSYIKRGQLLIKELPYGSTKAEAIQGDAVYSRQAILQRKITVWDIEVRR